MPISVRCSDCGKALKAPDDLAGQKAKCPDCGAVVTVPNAAWESEAAAGEQDSVDELANDRPGLPAKGTLAQTPCPTCGELIVATAARCRFCGELFDLKTVGVDRVELTIRSSITCPEPTSRCVFAFRSAASSASSQ